MTLRVIEGFDFMPNGLSQSERKRIWAAKHYYFYHGTIEEVPNVFSPGRFDFGKAWASPNKNITNTTSGESHVIPIGLNETTGICGVAVFRGSNSQNSCCYVSFYNGVYVGEQFTVCFYLNGVVQVRRGGPTGTILVTSVTGVFYEDNWFYAEIRGHVDNTSGSVEVRINTETVIDLVDANTQNITDTANFDCVEIGWRTYDSNEVVHFLFDDLYFLDELGTENNTFLGTVRVKTQFLTGDGSHIDFLIGGSSPASTNWESASNSNLDDTKYVYSDVPGDYDLYTIEPILNSPVVYGVQVCTAARQDDATQRNLHNVIKAGATLSEGDDHFVNQEVYSYHKDIWELNPDTGVGFTGTEVNGLEIGPKVEA